MIKKSFLYALCFLLLFFMEAIIRPVTVFGVSPQYVLCGVAAIGIWEKEKFGAIFGLLFGLLCDFASGSAFGSQAIVYMITGIIAGVLVEVTLSKGLLSTLLIAEASIIIFGGLRSILYIILNEAEPMSVLIYILLPKILLSLPFAIIIYFMIKFIYWYTSPDRERKRKRQW